MNMEIKILGMEFVVILEIRLGDDYVGMEYYDCDLMVNLIFYLGLLFDFLEIIFEYLNNCYDYVFYLYDEEMLNELDNFDLVKSCGYNDLFIVFVVLKDNDFCCLYYFYMILGNVLMIR